MLRFLPSPIIGILSLFFYTLNVVIAGLCVLSLVIAKCVPIPAWQEWIGRGLAAMPNIWIKGNDLVREITHKTQIVVNLPTGLNTQTFYLVIANHQCWSDILVLFSVFNQRIPMLKFFLKRQLGYVPIIGQLCWIYGYPFMYRHTKAQLQKNPAWKGRDYIQTRKACERFKKAPGSLMIFVEGTRFTQQKHDKQQSPYHYLLKPKAGGIALALQCMEDRIQTLLDVTIIYPPHQKTFWAFCCGKTNKIIVDVKSLTVPSELQGDYESDPAFRSRFQQFINQRWAEKDKLLYKYEILS